MMKKYDTSHGAVVIVVRYGYPAIGNILESSGEQHRTHERLLIKGLEAI